MKQLSKHNAQLTTTCILLMVVVVDFLTLKDSSADNT